MLNNSELKQAGIHEYAFLETAGLSFNDDVRQLCVQNKCGKYGSTWACPPAVGTVYECKRRLLQYDTMLLFSGIFPLEDWRDEAALQRCMQGFRQVAQGLDDMLKPIVGERLFLSIEGCDICSECTYPHAPCRFPDKLHHSMSGYSLVVKELAEKAGMAFDGGEGRLIFFGAVAFNGAKK